MKDFIEALQIFLKYVDEGSYHSKFPTHCEHDELTLFVDHPVSEEDIARLEKLGFSSGTEYGSNDGTDFISYTFGSC